MKNKKFRKFWSKSQFWTFFRMRTKKFRPGKKVVTSVEKYFLRSNMDSRLFRSRWLPLRFVIHLYNMTQSAQICVRVNIHTDYFLGFEKCLNVPLLHQITVFRKYKTWSENCKIDVRGRRPLFYALRYGTFRSRTLVEGLKKLQKMRMVPRYHP